MAHDLATAVILGICVALDAVLVGDDPGLHAATTVHHARCALQWAHLYRKPRFQAPKTSADCEGVLIQHGAMHAKRTMVRRIY